MRMSTFLNDLPGEIGDDSPKCSECADTGVYNNFVGERDFCDCASGEIAHGDWCVENDDFDTGAAQARLDEMDYQAGVAQGEQYSAECKIYGSAMANDFAMMDELAAYNRGE